MSDYTPTTEEARENYQVGRLDDGVGVWNTDGEFERWLETVKAAAWDEGVRFVLDTGWIDGNDAPPNPYRSEPCLQPQQTR